MRILHTSDWHLGRSFHRVDMLDHQAQHLDHLMEVVRAEKVDVVAVAGDIYDRALPPVDAVRVASEIFGRLASSGVRVVVTSGNHDSAHRLGFADDLIDAAGVHLRTRASRVGEAVVIDDDHGPVAFHGIPYLDPDLVREPWQLGERGHQAALGEAMRRVRRDLDDRGGVRSVVLAHAFVAGQTPVDESDSERDISVGGVSRVPTTLFDDIDYVALGHLHGSHTLTESVRYSGSPLAYSFSETNHTKGSWLVDLDANGLAGAEFVPAPVPRPLARLQADLESLLTDPAWAEHEGSWLQVTLTDDVRPLRAMEQLRARFPHVLNLEFAPSEAPARVVRRPAAGRSMHDITLDFVRDMRGADASTSEAALLLDACDSCSADADLDEEVS